ncbi:hypothetical protein NFI96_017527, partial [Prochilodus magdalenae]
PHGSVRWKMATRVLHRCFSGLNEAKNWTRTKGQVATFIRGLPASNRNREESWFKSLFVRKVDPRKDAHSHLLAKKEESNLYKIQFHNVKPECLDAYNKLWGGYPALTEVMNKLKNNKLHWDFLLHEGSYGVTGKDKSMKMLLLHRRNQLLLEFSFWNEPVPRQGPNIYELRSYQLRVEWENQNEKLDRWTEVPECD